MEGLDLQQIGKMRYEKSILSWLIIFYPLFENIKYYILICFLTCQYIHIIIYYYSNLLLIVKIFCLNDSFIVAENES